MSLNLRCLSRWTVALLVVLLLLSHAVGKSPKTTDVRSLIWQTGTWYRLDDSHESNSHRAQCPLPSGNGQRFLLVIGCLGDANKRHSVRLHLDEVQTDAVALSQRIRKIALPSVTVSLAELNVEHKFPVKLQTLNRPLTDESHDFFLHVTDGNLEDSRHYAKISARKIACGTRVRVWLDRQLPLEAITPGRFDELIEMLETDVLPRVESQFGCIQDVDGDGGFSVVISPWLSRLQGGSVSIGGMVRGSDFRLDVAPPFGNRCDMLLLNSELPMGPGLRDLLSHEVAHAACISQRLTPDDRSISEEQDWLSEALAHLAEPGWSNRAARVAEFLNDPSRFPLVVPDYYRAGLWRNAGCRGATFLFADWCATQHGPDLCRRLAQSNVSGIRNFEQATSSRFEDLFRTWSLTMSDRQCVEALDSHDSADLRHRAGIRRQKWTTADGEFALEIHGSAFAAVELQINRQEAHNLKIEGDPAAMWQFSLRQLTDSEPATETPNESRNSF